MEIVVDKVSLEAIGHLNGLIESLYGDSSVKQHISSRAVKAVQIFDKSCLGSLFIHENPSIPEGLLIGNYECVEDQQISNELLRVATEEGNKQKKKYLIGPINGDTWHSYRFNEKNHIRFSSQSIHQEYYPDQWVEAGFRTFQTYFSQRVKIQHRIPIQSKERWFRDRGFDLRSFDTHNLDQSLCSIHCFCEKVFANNPLYSTISEKEFIELYKPILPLLDPSLIDMVYHEDQMVGLFFALNDFYHPKQAVVKTIARDPDNRYRGMAHVLSEHFYWKMQNKGYEWMVHAYFHENNKSKNVSNDFGGQPFQRHFLYHKML